MIDIAHSDPNPNSRKWMLHQTKKKAEREGDFDPWTPQQVIEFHDDMERTPQNRRELADLATSRLLDIKHDLEEGDSSIASILIGGIYAEDVRRSENEMRKYLYKELCDKARNRYAIEQEGELADAKRPDLRFHRPEIGAVPVELKLADKWRGKQLFERLENQLCGDYLRDRRSTRGIFLLVTKNGKQHSWKVPNKNTSVDFEGLIHSLRAYWQQLSPSYPKIDEITVIGIDLSKREE